MTQIDHDQIAHYQRKLQYEIDSRDLYHAVQDGERIVVIDARSFEAYQQEHIPGAMSFPHQAITKQTAEQRLDHETLYVIYCDGIGCNASTKGALKLAQLGYRVKELMGGIDWWRQEQYPISEGELSKHCDISCGCDGM